MLSLKMQYHKIHGSHSLASFTQQTPSSQFQEIKSQFSTRHYEISQDSTSVK
jgi:hypothetical protein